MIELPNASERRYLGLAGFGAVYVIAPPDDMMPCLVGTGGNLARAVGQARHLWHPDVDLCAAYWSRNPGQVRVIVDALGPRTRLNPDRLLAVTAPRVCAIVEWTAEARGFRLKPHAQMLASARAALAAVESGIRVAHGKGQLKWFNTAFAKARESSPGLSYTVARVRLRDAVLRRVMLRQPLDPDSLGAEIFPQPSKTPRRPLSETGSAEG